MSFNQLSPSERSFQSFHLPYKANLLPRVKSIRSKYKQNQQQTIKHKLKDVFVDIQKKNWKPDLENLNKNQIETGNKKEKQETDSKKFHFVLMDFSKLGVYRQQQRKGFLEGRPKKKINALLPSINQFQQLQESKRELIKQKSGQDTIIRAWTDKNINTPFTKDKTIKQLFQNLQSKRSEHPRLNTQPSIETRGRSETQQKYRKRNRPRVIQNQILKHSTNLNIIRKKMFSENQKKRSKIDVQKHRNQIQSSQIQYRKKFHNQINQQCEEGKKQKQQEIQLLTFYPKQKQVENNKDTENQFLVYNGFSYF